VSTFTAPEVIEVACGYGKATLYLAAAAKRCGGFLNCVDVAEPLWKGRTALHLLGEADLLDICRIAFRQDARWYLLELFRKRPGQWIDLAYLDLTHTVEVDSFVALCLWTHLRANGILVFDDLDWVPAIHGAVNGEFSAPTISHVRALFDYVSGLSDVAEKAEWGQPEVEWRWGFLRKRSPTPEIGPRLQESLQILGNHYWRLE
jgi:predicted O-methyltransferase YrrM